MRPIQLARERKLERRLVKRTRYDAQYRAVRRSWAAHMAAGELVRCIRCVMADVPDPDAVIQPGQAWDLDHVGEVLHPSHAHHNRGARRTNRSQP